MMNFKSSCFELKERLLLFSQRFANRKTQFKRYVHLKCILHRVSVICVNGIDESLFCSSASCCVTPIIFRHKMHDHWVMVYNE